MADIIKTWPVVVTPQTTAEVFSPHHPPFTRYYFSIGHGRPKQKVERVWFTYGGRILGWFAVEEVVCNDGSIPPLRRLDGGESGWQFRKDAWLAVCVPPCNRLRERVFMAPFRGFRYFDFNAHRSSPEARHRLP